MKTTIHPTYYKDAKAQCTCGASFQYGNTVKETKVEVCSHCHPFYTGKKKIVDASGRVERFKARMEQAEKLKQMKEEAKKKKTKNILDEIEEEKEKQEQNPTAPL